MASQARLNSLETELNQSFSLILLKKVFTIFEIEINVTQAGAGIRSVGKNEPEPRIFLLLPEYLGYRSISTLSRKELFNGHIQVHSAECNPASPLLSSPTQHFFLQIQAAS